MENLYLFNWVSILSDNKWIALYVLCSIGIMFLWPYSKKSNKIFFTSFLLILLTFIIHQLVFNTIAEDSFIGFRFSRNLANGHGFVFNIGERIEGYSDFLWMVMGAGANRFFGMDIPLFSRIGGFLISTGVFLLAYKLMFLFSKDRYSSLLTIFIIGSIGAYASWGLSGLETPLFALCLILAIFTAYHKRWWWTSIFLLLMSLTRIDGVVFFPPFLLYAVLFTPKKERIKVVIALFLPFLMGYIPYTLWRMSYFGYFFPNTVVTKKGASLLFRFRHGAHYISSYLAAYSSIIILFCFGLIAVVNKFIEKAYSLSIKKIFKTFIELLLPEETLLLLICGTYLCFIFYIGGDWMPSGRFFYAIICPLTILAVNIWRRFVTIPFLQFNKTSCLTIFIIACFFNFYNSFLIYNHIPEVRVWKNEVIGLATIGKWLNTSLPDTMTVAVTANGALSYYSQLPTIDMLGLTDEHIGRKGKRKSSGCPGHLAFDYEYVASRRPQVICYSGGGFSDTPHPFAIRDEFKELYDPQPFYFKNSDNPKGKFVEPWLLRSEKDKLIKLLTKDDTVEAYLESTDNITID